MARRRSLRLSTRVTLFFGALALLGGVGLTVATYFFARNSLLDQHETNARADAIRHAEQLNDALITDPDDVSRTLFELDIEPDGFAVLMTQPRQLQSRIGFDEENFPAELRESVTRGQSGQQQFVDDDGTPYLGVGISLQAFGVGYLEAFPLDTTERTLQVLATALTVGSILATIVAVFFGWSTSRRLLRPLSRVADAAGEFATGSLETRLDDENDPDLNRLAGSFNEMADSVQQRIEREQRFASDVSHELRSPITALTAAVEVLDARREELPDRAQQALDVVVGQVRRFDDMVIDLLELSRLEAGSQDLHTEPADLVELCDRVSHRYGHGDLPIEVHRRAHRRAMVDRVRFERILGNLLDNATHHGGGPTRITIEPGSERQTVLIAVEDSGPGVAAGERTRIFERFARGSAARNRIGTGLGLALVAEHAAALGGTAWVEEAPGGGARFVVQLPTVSA
ncbi:MAG: HAMP domain-containing sensor histidine kinase [Ilumatobacter sp.]|uniref:HAMP domain-containing sensor histidine kinase n=1 Tax=Ilumatobacter sp. TaxID=1967498 RepID=UPI002616C3BF|nr:HAMP domain-containing sensor histidine kinase [Ilumatobacter sp.]MDJ0770558.1 HAMP domain-containing sensor histidine kinase [Ilumatobacter sp.]